MKCPGCAALLTVPSPAPETVPAAPPSPARPKRVLLWILVGGGGVALLFIAGVVFFVARTAAQVLSGGPGRLHVDNISAEVVEVSVDGAPQGTVKPFEFGTYTLPSGAHDVVVSAAGREIDRENVKVPGGKSVVFNPRGRGSYGRISLEYSTSRLVSYGGGPRVQSVGSPRTLESDFGPLDAIPPNVPLRIGEKQGTVTRVKVVREPPMKFTPAEAVAFLQVPPDTFVGSPNHTLAAFRALISAPSTRGALPAIVNCLESKDFVLTGMTYPLLWENPVDLPEDRLRAWVTNPPESLHDRTRAAHAILLLAEKGRAAGLPSLTPAQVKNLRDGNLNLVLRAAPPARARPAFRGLLDAPLLWDLALEAVKTRSFQPDLETANRVDDFILKLPPAASSARLNSRRDWVESWLHLLNTNAPDLPKEEVEKRKIKFVADMAGGTGQGGVLRQLVENRPLSEIKPLYLTLNEHARAQTASAFAETIARQTTPVTDDQLGFIDLVFTTPVDLKIRHAAFFSHLVSVARERHDSRFVAKLEEVTARETDPEMKRRYQATMDQLLKRK